ncbi:MAG: hypothetical protein IJ460_04865 [Clostridia bacterium]|nr:hypothetical protein [Clostridia bacterium]
MSRLGVIAIALALMTNLCSCGNSAENMHERIHSKFYTMPSYTAQCQMTVNSNKTSNKYDFTCTYDNAGNRYRIDYPDLSVILTETDARIIRGDSVINIPSDDGHMLMFVNTFFESYYAGENASIEVSSGADSGFTVLETELISPTKFGHSMKLWINNKTMAPRTMKVYDEEGKETIAVAFEGFETAKLVEEEKFTQ